MGSKKAKFKFDIKFQEDILKYTVTDDYGYKALSLYKPEYFDLIEHTIIATVLKNNFRKDKKVIHNPNVLTEKIRALSKSVKYSKYLDDSVLKNTIALAEKLYSHKVKDGNDILDSCMKFAQYVELDSTLEQVDILDFDQYDEFAKKIRKAITIGFELKESHGTFLFNDVKLRQYERKFRDDTYAFPLRQLNKLTNSGGYPKGAVITIIDKPKALKTAMLVNIVRGYAMKKQNVIIFDLENGEQQYAERLEQSILNCSKADLLSGGLDEKQQKAFRKYKRLGIEVVIKRLPAFTTTAATLRYWLDYYYNEHGLTFKAMIIDYIGKMGNEGKSKDDNQRISEAYVEVQNLADEKNIQHTFTGHHVTRPAHGRRATKYQDNDTAKCIDINRHVDMMLGLQQSPEEEEAGVARLEIIIQRDGPPRGRVWFKVKCGAPKV